MKEIFASFTQSLQRLDEILQDEKTIKNRDSAIKRFEFTVELAWKCIQKFLREQKIICRSPKECLKEAFKFGLIADDERWLGVIEDRNITAHTYDEEVADEVYKRLPGYKDLFAQLKETLQKELEKMNQ